MLILVLENSSQDWRDLLIDIGLRFLKASWCEGLRMEAGMVEEDVGQAEGAMYTRGRPGDEDKRGSSMVFIHYLTWHILLFSVVFFACANLHQHFVLV